MPPIEDHPQRYALANELHARPFPIIKAPGRAAYLAIKRADNAVARDRNTDREHLLALLDRYGAPHPQPDATHYSGSIGRHFLKWESHTEFVTYTILGEGVSDTPFDAKTFGMFPEDWLDNAPGTRMTSALIRIEELEDEQTVIQKTEEWFVPESLAISRVLNDELIVSSDFRIDEGGHIRFGVFARKGAGPRRIGRVVQRLTEIETYKAMSMLGLTRARALSPKMGAMEQQLGTLLHDMGQGDRPADEVLQSLLTVSADVENMIAQSAFRFSGTAAYSRIVNQRIEVLREERFNGLQTFAEFMMRRFDPAMRTVASTEARLKALSDRAMRAGDLLRTKVDVDRSAQNQELLSSMNKRADEQLRLQRTVEGLSVVAISYYAVNLVVYAFGPAAESVGLSKTLLAAGATPIVLLIVWWLIKQIHKRIS
ncbi:Uncharacterized membrane-anchored protein [Cognatiyoonia sediminum]|uniref:Uncharacterized membrane-anchored protein n=1 Tax=Cognatiyoonia sediminum TaxID=1508389 RepID=A0A1M5MVW7_9RHOB|nr:DUF3422 domain-containing protein [Cognatiyoonia sediminum]SHG81272.1 Uncharacterized membrane-anchored protein [Cognatiyoonia sediminum]